MNRTLLTGLVVSGLFLATLTLSAGVAGAQTFPVVAGTTEIQVGIAGVVFPEESSGSISAQPEVRLGYFVAEGLLLQAVGDMRVWPGGSVAPASYGASGNLLWFPNLGTGHRSLYLMGGAGGKYSAADDALGLESAFDPLVRGGLGVKTSLENLGLRFLSTWHLTVEYRNEYLLADDSDFLSGMTFGVSRLR